MFSKIYEWVLKSLPVLTILFILFCVASQNSNSYDDGYNQGTEDAWYSILEECETEDPRESFFEENVYEVLSDAEHYTIRNSSWHPEEAVYIIDIYFNPDNYPDEDPPTHEEYLDAVESLCVFYEYFYGRHYEGYYD